MYIFKGTKKQVNPNLSNVDKVLNTHLKEYKREIDLTNKAISKTLDEVSTLREMFLDLNNQITKQEKELDIYRKGYANNILKNFYEDLLDLFELIEEHYEDNPSEDFEKIKKYSSFMIQDIGIKKFVPPINEEVRKLKGINIHPDFTPTDIESQDGTIEKVLKYGYKKVNEDNSVTYIRSATVKIYKFNEGKTK